MLIFDIETGPLADELLLDQFQFEPPPHPGEFDPAGVKYGNTKDPDKRAAKLKECQDAHNLAVANYEQDVAAARDQAWRGFKENAALQATTGQVLAIGLQRGDKPAIIHGGTEADRLARFWKKYTECRQQQAKMVGANICGFDLPFLIRRSWMLGVDVPSSAYEFTGGKWVNFDRLFFDLRTLWLLGQSNTNCESSLDTMARSLGVGRKTEGVSGGDFARLWFGTAEEQQQAVMYLLNDLKLTAAVAAKLGVN